MTDIFACLQNLERQRDGLTRYGIKPVIVEAQADVAEDGDIVITVGYGFPGGDPDDTIYCAAGFTVDGLADFAINGALRAMIDKFEEANANLDAGLDEYGVAVDAKIAPQPDVPP